MTQPCKTPPGFLRHIAAVKTILPGLALCLGVTAVAMGLEAGERVVMGKAWLEALVLAILLGTLVRSVWTPQPFWQDGIAFSAKFLLEIAVVLLGASVSLTRVLAAGPALLGGIALVVVCAIAVSVLIGKLLHLPTRMALLIACGNAICGNSAISAVAPVIEADSADVAAAIAFTAVLGVGVVLALPVLGHALAGCDQIWCDQLRSPQAYGAFAGLTVYAVPQVLAAAAPLGPMALQMGTLVKLMRVLMLGPVCLVLSLVAPRLAPTGTPKRDATRHPSLSHLVPWFILGFILMAGARAADILPHATLAPMGQISTVFTVVSMAALGLGVDVRTVAQAGVQVTLTVVLSLAALGLISLALVWGLQIQ